MPFSEIDLLPDPPQRDADPDTFADRADNFVVAMQVFSEQLNVFIAELQTAAALIAAAPAYADPGLVALTGLTPAADKLPYFTGSGASALTTLTNVARTLLAQTSQANMRSVGLGLGTAATQDSSAFDSAGAASGAVSAHVGASDPHAQYLLESSVSPFIMGLLNDADQAAALATLGALGVTSSDLDSAGHLKLTNGFMIQWGSTTVAANGSTGVTYDQAYSSWSKAFPTGVGEFTTGQAPTQAEGYSFTTTGFQIFTGSENSFTAHWIAIGV